MQNYLQANLLWWLLHCATVCADITVTSSAIFSNVSPLFSPCSALMLSSQNHSCISGFFSHVPLAMSCILFEAGSQFGCSHIHVLLCSICLPYLHILLCQQARNNSYTLSHVILTFLRSLVSVAYLSLGFVSLSLILWTFQVSFLYGIHTWCHSITLDG